LWHGFDDEATATSGGPLMGTVVLSIDAALGWGVHDHADSPTRVENGREGWRRLVDLLDTFGLPATWAIAGHLFLDDCDGNHVDHPRGPSWFDHERTRWADRPELRFAPGLVETVRESGPDHEIAAHGFSHVEFGHPETTAATARAELAACRRAARDLGIELSTFVFPRNSIGHRRELAAAGFNCYRGVIPTPKGHHRKLMDAMVGSPDPRLVTPAVDDWGLVDVPASLHLFSFDGIARALLEPAFGDPVVTHVERGLDELVGSNGVFHLRMEPNRVRSERDVERLRQVFARIDEHRDEIDVATMATVADRTVDTQLRNRAGEVI
jgi:peptidoglycan/xylan/chitin deacetylase (PgdA/CDA1 family)